MKTGAGGDRSKGVGIIFYWRKADKKKSFWKGRHDRPLILSEHASTLLKQKIREEISSISGGERKMDELARYHWRSLITSPIVPWFLTWQRVFEENRDGLGGYEGE